MRGWPATSKNSSPYERPDMTDIQERPLVDPDITVDDFAAQATAWFEENTTRRPSSDDGLVWGEGQFDVSVFSDMSFEDEQAHILSIAAWIQEKSTQGYHAVDWPVEYGGLGLSRAHARALGRIERQFQSPGSHELVSVTVGLVASTIRVLGSDALKERFIADSRRADLLACQLFSEPGAGSDLAGLATRAVRDGDEWVINGAKNWITNATIADYYVVFAKTDRESNRITAFIVEADRPGFAPGKLEHKLGIKGSPTGSPTFDDVRVPAANVIGLNFKEQEAGYLAGVVAGKLTTMPTVDPRINDKKIVGFVGGMEIPPVQKFEAGFIAGAKQVKPSIKTQSKYLSQPPDFIEAGKSMIEGGADIIFAAAGATGNGTSKACQDNKALFIGVDSDQYNTIKGIGDTILTSAVKRVDNAVFMTVKDAVDGKVKGGENKVFGLAEDGVGLAPYHDWDSKMPQEVKDAVAKATEDIKAGTVTVPESSK